MAGNLPAFHLWRVALLGNLCLSGLEVVLGGYKLTAGLAVSLNQTFGRGRGLGILPGNDLILGGLTIGRLAGDCYDALVGVAAD